MRNLSRALLAAALFACGAAPGARAVEPITIGFSMELTGPFAVVGKTGLLAFKIWEEEVNAEGGLLGRPVKLVYYDDQSNPSLVPGIYTKLIDIDKVDLLISSYGTNLVVPGDAGRDLAQPAVLRPVRAGRQREVPLSEILLDAALRPRTGEDLRRGLVRPGGGAEPEAQDGRDRRHRRRIPAQGGRKRARARQGERHRHRLRPGLSADHGRFRADHSLRAGGPTGSGLHRLISVGHGRHPAFGRRTRPQYQDARRRPCRTAGGSDQDAARRDGQRHRQCRFVGAGPDNAIPRRHEFHQEIPGKGAGRRGRPARLFPAALRL